MTRDIFFRLLFSFFVFFLIFALHRMITISPRAERPALARRPLLFAHRGGADLAPENTLVAFTNALRYDTDVLELDVHLTADDELVVIHDGSVDRTTNGSGRVGDLTLAQIKALDAGYRFTPDDGATYPYRGQGITIPTLQEVYTTFPDMLINVEMKDDDVHAAERLAQVIQQAGAEDRSIVGSFHRIPARAFRELAPDVATYADPTEVRTFFILSSLHLWRLHRPLSDAYQVPMQSGRFRLDTASFITNAHRLNQQVQYWTINDPADMRRLLQLGADGIMTNRPDLALQVFRELGFKD
ncbi:MAG: glycerophosphodiester phosphodiesterase [Chloroflexi bacterium]|nr:glycerophosphodiester phosphodiesterase [Chloroflexota bacterium]